MSTWLTDARAFESLFSSSPSAIVALDAACRVIACNPAFTLLTGYTKSEFIGMDLREVARAPLLAFVEDACEAAAVEKTLQRDVTIDHKNGSTIAAEATSIPVIDGNAAVALFLVLQDAAGVAKTRRRFELVFEHNRQELLDIEGDFQSLFDRNPDGIMLIATSGVILDVNDSLARISRRSRDEIVGRQFRSFLHGGELERGLSFFRRALEGESVQFDIGSTRGDGAPLHLQITLFPKYAQGLVVGAYCAVQDVTEQRSVQRKLEIQAQRMRDLYLLATTAEYTDAQVMSTLQTGCRLLGLESGAIVDGGGGLRVEMRYDSLELFAGENERVVEIAKTVLAQRDPVCVHISETEGDGYGTWIASRLVVGGTLRGVLLFFSRMRREEPFEELDVDTVALMAALVAGGLERRRNRSHLRTLAYYDSLTGLPNRLFFQERLRDELIDEHAHPRPLAVLFFDLDRFKDINDTLGHAMGDRFMQLLARRLTNAIGERGFVARMSGDEFCVLVRDVEGKPQVEEIASELVRAVEEPFRVEGYEQFISTSIGIALSPLHGRDEQTLIKSADLAAYRVKSQGGNGYLFYDESFQTPVRARLAEEKRLRRAVERQEFVLHYQPIVDVATEEIVAAEALVRWNDPQRGLIMPDDFIPVAEATGLIVQIGEWVIANAAAQLRRWSERAPLGLAVNISARQFQNPELCHRLMELVTQTGFDPRRIEIEITESMALSDAAQSIETIRRFKSMGAAIAVDDFGTGHSSLRYLRRFAVDRIKIDRSFVAGIGTEPSDETIVKAIIAMGHSLGLTIVAEGVENRTQFEFLRSHKCDRAQGYLFSPPLPAADLESLPASWRGTIRDTG